MPAGDAATLRFALCPAPMTHSRKLCCMPFSTVKQKAPFRELFTANVYSRKALTDFH